MPPAPRLRSGVRPLPVPRPRFAYTRTKKIKSLIYLIAQGRHARREDQTGPARVRADAVPGTSLGWSFLDGPVPEARPVHTTHYAAAHRAFLRSHGARLRKSAPLGIHLQVNVSPEWWVEEGGGLHDPTNPRIRAHWDAIVAWAREAFGTALFALRIDLDETGGGVADVFLAPLRRLGHKMKAAAGQMWVSVNRALEELTEATKHRRSENWHAINTSWAAYASSNLDPCLVRGIPKKFTGQRNLSPDVVRGMHEELDERELQVENKELLLTCMEKAQEHVLSAVLLGWQLHEDEGGLPVLRRPADHFLPPEVARKVDESTLNDDLQLIWPTHANAIRAAARLLAMLTAEVAGPEWGSRTSPLLLAGTDEATPPDDSGLPEVPESDTDDFEP